MKWGSDSHQHQSPLEDPTLKTKPRHPTILQMRKIHPREVNALLLKAGTVRFLSRILLISNLPGNKCSFQGDTQNTELGTNQNVFA